MSFVISLGILIAASVPGCVSYSPMPPEQSILLVRNGAVVEYAIQRVHKRMFVIGSDSETYLAPLGIQGIEYWTKKPSAIRDYGVLAVGHLWEHMNDNGKEPKIPTISYEVAQCGVTAAETTKRRNLWLVAIDPTIIVGVEALQHEAVNQCCLHIRRMAWGWSGVWLLRDEDLDLTVVDVFMRSDARDDVRRLWNEGHETLTIRELINRIETEFKSEAKITLSDSTN